MVFSYADAFLDAILQDPEDDAPRLIYADWLEETGDAAEVARAEFIRLQCELAPMAADDPRRPALAARERQLRDLYGAPWAGPLAECVREYEFLRGFVERIRLDGKGFLQHAPVLFRLAPIRHLDLYVERDQVAALVKCHYLAHLTSLDLGAPLNGVEGLADLLDSHYLHGLIALRLRSVLTSTVLGRATGLHLPRLVTLDLGANNLGVEGLQALLDRRRLPSLRALHLNSNALGNLGVQALARSPLLGQLSALDLNINHVGPAGVDALMRSPHLGRLASLWLAFNTLGDAGAASLATCPHLASLARLYLGSNRLGGAAVAALATSPHLGNLTHLDLDYNDIPAEALQELARSRHLHRLQALYLRCGRGITGRTRKLLQDRFGESVCRF
jgi:uncharacterized protein (TIGR02996 family)